MEVKSSELCCMEMVEAIDQTDLEKIKLLLNNGVNVNACDDKGVPCFLKAVVSGQKNILELFLGKGVNVNVKDEKGNCGLRLAIKNKDMSIARLLLSFSADVESINSVGVTLFEEAMHSNSLDMMQLLVDHDCDINKLGSDGNHYLSQAIEKGNDKQAQLILQAGAEVNILEHCCTSPIGIAIEKNSLSCVQLLLCYKVNVHGEIHGQTFLQYAVDRNASDIVSLLIEHNADVNGVGSLCKEPPLLRAVTCTNDASLVKLLISHNAKVNAQTKNLMGSTTALMSALKSVGTVKINTDIVKVLLESGADVNQHDENGTTPLLLAAENDLVEIVKLLIEKGAHVGVKNCKGVTPLMATSSTELVSLFVKNGVDINAIGKFSPVMYEKFDSKRPILPSRDHGKNSDRLNESLTALMKAAKYGQKDIFQALVQNGADIHIVNNLARTALFYATEKARDIQSLKLLISKGAQINLKDISDMTPLTIALRNNWTAAIHIFLHNGVDLSMTNSRGTSPLVYALTKLDVLRSLIYHGADVNAADRLGMTPLHLAAACGPETFSALQVLVEAGANVDQRDCGGRTALMFAAEKDQYNKIDYLLDHGADINVQSTGQYKKSALSNAMSRNYYTAASYCCVSRLLDRGVKPQLNVIYKAGFHRLIFLNQQHLVCKLVKYFACPITVTFENVFMASPRWHRLLCGVIASLNPLSPFCSALLSGNSEIAHYFNDNWFLTQSDVTMILNNRCIEQYLTTCQYSEVTWDSRKRCEVLMKTVYKQPWSLAKLSFVRTSSALGEGPERIEKVKALPLPAMIKDKLLFQTPVVFKMGD